MNKKKKCPPHEWRNVRERDATVTVCRICGESWRDLMRGFGTNVRPKRVVR